MPMLRRHRRPRDRFGRLRGRRTVKRKRRNLVKFIPEADSDFAYVAQGFAAEINRDTAAYGLSADDVAIIENAVKKFRTALAATSRRFTRNPQVVMAKDEARAAAEKVIRKYANIIRANLDISESKKTMLRIKVRPKRLGKRKCPKYPPMLMFAGSGDGVVGGIAPGSGSGVHVLKYYESDDYKPILKSKTYGMNRRAKPDGAARIELYFDMIPVGEPVPVLPNERGWPKYLRSFTKSPMEVQYPIPSEPMLIVYWARWADSAGDVSLWSKPCIARVEGWSSTAVPMLEGQTSGAANATGRGETGTRIVGGSQVETRCVFIQTPIAGELPSAESLPLELEQLLQGRLLQDDRERVVAPAQLPAARDAA